MYLLGITLCIVCILVFFFFCIVFFGDFKSQLLLKGVEIIQYVQCKVLIQKEICRDKE